MEGTAVGRLREQAADSSIELVGSPQHPPRVSVVIPTFNHSASLERLLAVLRRSETPPGGVEVIVVDDGSTDDTAEVVARSGARHVWQRNGGTAAARDRGWRESRGEVVVFFDDDVIPEPQTMELLVKALQETDGVGAHFVALRGESLIAQYTHADGLIDHRVVDGEVRWLITGAAAFRRAALERVGGFDLEFIAAGEDVDLSLRMIAAGCKLSVQPDAVVRHYHRARFRQLLETCYRYGTFSPSLAGRHNAYRGERTSMAVRRLNPLELIRLYRRFRKEANRRRSLLFVVLHQLVVIPYVFGLVRGRFRSAPLAAPSWRQLPGVRRRESVGSVVEASQLSAVQSLEVAPEPEASAV